MSKNAILSVLIVSVIIAIFGLAYVGLNSASTQFSGTTGFSGIRIGADGLVFENGGAISGDVVVSGSTLDINGITTTYNTQTMAQATTTVCAIQSPAATTTLARATANFSVSSTTASRVTIAKATTAFATTTALGVADIAANGQATVLATTTPSLMSTLVISPSSWVVVGIQGGTGTFSPTGTCTATFESVF